MTEGAGLPRTATFRGSPRPVQPVAPPTYGAESLRLEPSVDDAGVARIDVHGDLDRHSSASLEALGVRLLVGDGAGSLVLSCSTVTHIDSGGLMAIQELHQVACEQGATLTVLDPSRVVRRLLALANLAGMVVDTPT